MQFIKHRIRIGHLSFEKKLEADLRSIAGLSAAPKVNQYVRKR